MSHIKDSKGTLYIIAGASGTGKSTLAEALCRSMEGVRVSVSHTTRPLRLNEKADEHYFFVSKQEFEKLIEKRAFLEYAKVFNHYYGTSRLVVEETLNEGVDVILDIDWQGARAVREDMECVSIFLLPPSLKELRSRLENRKREDHLLIEERLTSARPEISHYKEFDYLVINDKFEDALLDLQAIVRSCRLRLKNQVAKHNNLINGFLDKKQMR
jgi:guanylate kinase